MHDYITKIQHCSLHFPFLPPNSTSTVFIPLLFTVLGACYKKNHDYTLFFSNIIYNCSMHKHAYFAYKLSELTVQITFSFSFFLHNFYTHVKNLQNFLRGEWVATMMLPFLLNLLHAHYFCTLFLKGVCLYIVIWLKKKYVHREELLW